MSQEALDREVTNVILHFEFGGTLAEGRPDQLAPCLADLLCLLLSAVFLILLLKRGDLDFILEPKRLSRMQ
jgi:hypothetical protein